MGSYTYEIREIIELSKDYNPNLSLNEKIEIGRKSIFDFSYPIFDDNFKITFETNIIREFYTREIGFETIPLFKLKLNNWLNINMPYFNKLFESELFDFDPLTNVKFKQESNRNKNKDQNDTRKTSQNDIRDTLQNINSDSLSDVDNTSNVNQTSKNTIKEDNFKRDIHTDTPDQRLAITTNDGSGVIEFASSIDENKLKNDKTSNGEGKSDSNSKTKDHTTNETDAVSNDKYKSDVDDQYKSNIKNTDDYVFNEYGKVGNETYQEMVMKLRDSFIRIEKTIHHEMQQLFMLIYF